MQKIRLFISSAIFLVSFAATAKFDSEIFTYDDMKNAKGLHVTLQGTNWQAHEVMEEDITFFQDLFGNQEVMKRFGNGLPKNPKEIENRLRNIWLPRFQNGNPHGALTLFDLNTSKVGYAMVGSGGSEKGVGEISYALMPQYQSQKIMSGAIETLIKSWAPEVRRIGLGQNLDEIQDESIIKAFKCFAEEALSRIDATVSPSNPASWKILDKFGFTHATSKIYEENKEHILDLEQQEIKMEIEDVEPYVSKLFNSSSLNPLTSGVRYRLIDAEGKLRTFSMHEQFGALRYHFEYHLK